MMGYNGIWWMEYDRTIEPMGSHIGYPWYNVDDLDEIWWNKMGSDLWIYNGIPFHGISPAMGIECDMMGDDRIYC